MIGSLSLLSGGNPRAVPLVSDGTPLGWGINICKN